ncbi:MAG: hypothetical protein K2M42_09150 [Oscillospiraceae bacterium]|nr:hypothetical protein [Oscillospiraceae bacterium]
MLWCVLTRHGNVLIHPNYNVPGFQSQDAQKIKEKIKGFVGLCEKEGKSLECCHNMGGRAGGTRPSPGESPKKTVKRRRGRVCVRGGVSYG